MKKYSCLISLMFFYSTFMFAQLKVASSGAVGVQLIGTTDVPLSSLSIGGIGNATNKVDITSNLPFTTALNIYQVQPGYGTIYGINSIVAPGPAKNIAINGQCFSSNAMPVGISYGVLGVAGNHNSGCNYGVYGSLMGYTYGAGIVGTVGVSDLNIPGQYAGYFYGNVGVIGVINGVLVGNSDIRYKQNIAELETKKTVDNISKMVPIEYNLKQMYANSKSDTAKVKKGIYDEDSQVFKKKHYGLIAQDLQKLYPDLVYQNDSGYLSVNYTEIIPLLIESIKELKAEVDALPTGNVNSTAPSKVGANLTKPDASETDVLTYPVLEQNIPNPFNASCSIGFYLPTSVTIANIYVYDMNGTQLKSYSISERGKGTVTIQGSEFIAGMYLYALIADGKVIDTKRMILTK